MHNRYASVATLRWCSGSSRNAVRIPFGIGVQLRRNPQPDSRFIAFVEEGKLKKIEASGGAAQTICSAALVIGCSWNRDGVIIFSDGEKLLQVAASGGDAKPVTRLDASPRETTHDFPVFLPDGKHFFFTVHKSVNIAGEMTDVEISRDNKFFYYTKYTGSPGIWRRPVSGGPEVQLPGTGGVHLYRYWDLTNRGIFFVDGTPQPALKHLDFRNNRIEVIATLPGKMPLSTRGSPFHRMSNLFITR